MSLRATIERAISPGLGCCYRCRRPWKHPKLKRRGNVYYQQNRLRFWGLVGVEEHSTKYSETSSCFPLCESCWAALTPKERLPYYRQLWTLWMSMPPTDGVASWSQIESAVLSEPVGGNTP